MAELKAELTTLVDAAVERYRGQEAASGTRRVSLRAEVFDLSSGPRTVVEEES